MKIIFSGASASNCDSGISDGSPGPQVENDCDDCEKQIYNCDDCDKQFYHCDDCDKQIYNCDDCDKQMIS